MRIKLLLLAFGLCVITTKGTTYSLTPIKMASEDLKKVNAYYKANPLMTVETNYMAFDEHGPSNMRESKNGLYCRNADSYYTKILSIETLCTGNIIINVDHEDKLIVVADNKEKEMNPLNHNIDSLLLFCTDVNYKSINTAERIYTLDFSENDFSEYEKIDLVVDVKNYRYSKIILYYRAAMNLTNDYQGEEKPPRLEISYKNYRTAVLSKPLLEQSNYILVSSGKLMPANRFKKYQILDQRNKIRFGQNKQGSKK